MNLMIAIAMKKVILKKMISVMIQKKRKNIIQMSQKTVIQKIRKRNKKKKINLKEILIHQKKVKKEKF